MPLAERREEMRILNNKTFWLIWGVCLGCFFIFGIVDAIRQSSIEDSALMLSSQIFSMGAIALCYHRNKQVTLLNLVVAIVYNVLFISGLFGYSEGGIGLLWFALILVANLFQGIGLLAYLLINRLKNKSM